MPESDLFVETLACSQNGHHWERVSGKGAGGRNLVSSGHFKRGPKAGPRIHFDGIGGIGASPHGHVTRSDGTRQAQEALGT